MILDEPEDDQLLDDISGLFLGNRTLDIFESPFESVLDNTSVIDAEEPEEQRLDFWSEDFFTDPETDVSSKWASFSPDPKLMQTAKEQETGSAAQARAFETALSTPKRWFQQDNGRIPSDRLMNVPGLGLYAPQAGKSLRAMKRAAKRDGVNLSGGGYRSYEEQEALQYKEAMGIPVAEPGHSNHGWGTAADIDVNDPKVFQWLQKNAGRFGWENPEWAQNGVEPWHWEYEGGGSYKPQKKTTKRKTVKVATEPKYEDPELVSAGHPLSQADSLTLGVLEAVDESRLVSRNIKPEERSSREGGSIKAQLYRGFMDAGRKDLAKMVYTNAFDTWVNQESGWRPDATSPANNQGLANDGLFQIWRGHDYNSNGQVANMSAYKQALVVAKHFPHLEPNDIRRYARMIEDGSYVGWG